MQQESHEIVLIEDSKQPPMRLFTGIPLTANSCRLRSASCSLDGVMMGSPLFGCSRGGASEVGIWADEEHRIRC
jgi:hypothetical protein